MDKMAAPMENSETLTDLINCVDFAARKHRDQRRMNSTEAPYINHPIAVAKILTEAGITDPDVIQAGLLHDTVEDTDTTLEELEQIFGKKIKDIVAECSDDKSLEKQERKRLQIVHAPHKSIPAKLVSMADKIHNLRDLNEFIPRQWTPERVHQYFIWAKQVCEGYRGVNDYMEAELDRLFREKGVL